MKEKAEQLLSQSELQELIRYIRSQFSQDIGHMHSQLPYMTGKISDFPKEIQANIRQFRHQWGLKVFIFRSTWNDIKDYFDEDIIHFKKPIVSKSNLPLEDSDLKSLKDDIKHLREHAWKDFLERAIAIEHAWDLLADDFNADLYELDTLPNPSYWGENSEICQASLKSEMEAFRNNIKFLSKKSIQQFLAGLNHYPIGHPERHIYVYFWISCIAHRFIEFSTKSVMIGMSLSGGYGYGTLTWKHGWTNGIKKQNIIPDDLYWKTIQGLFLENYPWHLLMDLHSYNLFWHMNTMPEVILTWLEAYARPSIIRRDYYIQLGCAIGYDLLTDKRYLYDHTSKRLEEILYFFYSFYQKYLEVIEQNPAFQLPLPPEENISFTLSHDYFYRISKVFKNCSNIELQMAVINQLPSLKSIKLAKAAGINTVLIKEMFDGEELPKWMVGKLHGDPSSPSLRGAQRRGNPRDDVGTEMDPADKPRDDGYKVRDDGYKVLDYVLSHALDLSFYKQNILCWVSLYQPTHLPDIVLFFKKLQAISIDTLSLEEKKTIASILTTCLPQAKSLSSLTDWVNVAIELKDAYGMELVEKILSLRPEQGEEVLRDSSYIAQLLLDLSAYFNQLLRQRKPGSPNDVFVSATFSTVINKLKNLKIADIAQRFPDKSLEQVEHDFLTLSSQVEFPLSKKEFQALMVDYKEILKLRVQYDGVPLSALGKTAQRFGGLAKANPNNKDHQYHLWAIIAEAIRSYFEISPFHTQMLTAMAMLAYPSSLKGRIGQVRTGQGKSTISTLLATFLACQGRFIDIVTSNHSLAIRDQEKYAPFYAYFGITCSHICNEHPPREAFDGQILYGTNTDHEFSLLFDGLGGTDKRYTTTPLNYGTKGIIKRPTDVVLVDEVDNLFFEMALNSAYIACKDYSMLVDWICPVFWQKLKQIGPEKFSQLSILVLRTILSTYQNGFYKKQVEKFSDQLLGDWQSSAVTAFHYKERYHYVIEVTQEGSREKQEVVIVDLNTGHKSQGCVWEKLLHQFVEERHGLPRTPVTLTLAALSHPPFFTQYQMRLGLTGTMGSLIERQEVREVFEMDGFDVPTQTPIIRIEEPVTIKLTALEHTQAIINSVLKHTKKGQAVLVLFNGINETEEFGSALTAKNISHQVLNECQRVDPNYIIKRAGDPGRVTVATNTAARGTDISLSPITMKNGGLHVLDTSSSINERIGDQKKGRSGRQGQPGSYELILSLEDPHVQSLLNSHSKLFKFMQLLNLDSARAYNYLCELRTKSIQKLSQERTLKSKQEGILYSYVAQFQRELELIKETLSLVDIRRLREATSSRGHDLPNEIDRFMIVPDHPLLQSAIKQLAAECEITPNVVLTLQQNFIKILIEGRWANWLTKVSDEKFRKDTLEEYQEALRTEFGAFSNAGYAALQANPLEYFYNWIVLLVNYKEVVHADESEEIVQIRKREQIKLVVEKYSLSMIGASRDTFAKALRNASANNQEEDVLILLNCYPDIIDEQDTNPKSRKTALHIAVERDFEGVIQILCAKGAKQTIPNANNEIVKTKLLERYKPISLSETRLNFKM